MLENTVIASIIFNLLAGMEKWLKRWVYIYIKNYEGYSSSTIFLRLF